MSLPALTSILFFFFTFTVINAQTPPPVLDAQGNPVQVGVSYYLLPLLRPFGGLGLGPNRNHVICPLSVVQMRPLSDGLPISFSPVDQPATEGVVRVSTDYNFLFNFNRIFMAAMWKREPLDKSVGKYFITSNFLFGSRFNESQTIDNHFKIEINSEFGGDVFYKLSWCPTVCSTCEKVLCKDIGVHVDTDGIWRLALTDDNPHVVVFRKVEMEQINAI
ncbi:hypothetical protein Syun_026383 [Stephania yunnanensis]|uniref:Uncharacterized protein n=1 Tax=Stephania yunnanensis TaxID=152371 RepID=A0AAP0F0I2_9MAGN